MTAFLTQETWQFINSFAPWFSALGTVLAVFVAIYLARRDRVIRLEVSAGFRYIITFEIPGHDLSPELEYLQIMVVNVGHRDAQIIKIVWKVGILQKQYFSQLIVGNMPSPLPIRLHDGEEAKYLIPLDEKPDWLVGLCADMPTQFLSLQLRFIRVQVFTSVGKVIEAPLEPGLRKKLIEMIAQSKRPH